MGLPEMEGSCSKNCNGSHSGPYLGGVTGTRRKLYFNPAYFDPELLQVKLILPYKVAKLSTKFI
jgi:hypothetical protein